MLDTLFSNDTPLLDVRSPSEFTHGHFPASKNIPVLDNEQRSEVGTCYRQKGQSEAMALGHNLVSGDVLASRGQAWKTFIRQNPSAHIYCARGGLRSNLVHQWLVENNMHCPVIPSGYKAMRHHLLNTLDNAITDFQFIILCGPTGSGKTHFINNLSLPVIDLEKLANHRGSSFGSRVNKQPSQVTFENSIAVALIKAKMEGVQTIIIEDESKLIGRCCLPLVLQQIIKKSPVVLLGESMENRAQTIFDDYITHDLKDWQNLYGYDKGTTLFTTALKDNLARISRRLGGERFKEAGQLLNNAISALHRGNDTTLFYPVIEKLLDYYYDPMYHYQLATRERKILARGTKNELTLWFNDHYTNKNVISA